MLTFNSFVQLQEADTSRASNFEIYIKQALNAQLKSIPMQHVPAAERTPAKKIAATIISQLQSKGIHNTEFIRAGGAKGPISVFYAAHGATDGTSKADIRSMDNKFRFSVKASGGAALASGLQADQRATFYWALNANPQSNPQFLKTGKLVLDLVETHMSSIVQPAGAEKVIDIKHMSTVDSKPGILDAAANIKPAYSSKIKKWLKNIAKRDQDMKTKIGEALRKALEDDASFKKYYTFECATGQGKFGDIHLDGPWSANYILVFDYTGRVKMDEISSPDSPGIRTYAQNMKFRFRWKHGAKTGVSVDLPGSFLKKELAAESTTFSGLLMQEARLFEQQMLTEGLWDQSAALWARFKNWFVATMQKLKAAIQQAFSTGWDAVFKFFDLTPEGIETSWSPTRI